MPFEKHRVHEYALFSEQSEYKNEVSTFLTTFINVYIMLIALSIFIVFLISHYITSPLKLIQQKISMVQLGKLNEKIEWERNDELGKLIFNIIKCWTNLPKVPNY